MSWQRYAGFGLLGAGAGAGLGAVLRQQPEDEELLLPEQQAQQLALDLTAPTAVGAAAGVGGTWLAQQLMGRTVEPERKAATPEVLRVVDQAIPAAAVVADAPMTAAAEDELRGLMRTLGGMLEAGRGNRQWKGFANEKERMQRVGALLGDALKRTDPATVMRLKDVVDAVEVSGPVGEAEHKVFQKRMMNALYDQDSYRAALDHSLREPTWQDDLMVNADYAGTGTAWAADMQRQWWDAQEGREPRFVKSPEDWDLDINDRYFDSIFRPTPAMQINDLIQSVPAMADVTPEERRAALLATALVAGVNGPILPDGRAMFVANAMDVYPIVHADPDGKARVRQRALDLTRDELRKQSAELGFDLSDWELPAWARQATIESIDAIKERLITERDAHADPRDLKEVTFGEIFGASKRRGGV